MRALCAIVLILWAVVLAGCTATPVMTSSSTSPDPVQGAAINGSVHGGQNPISGASVYLYAVGTGGYGGKGFAASSSNASTSLLNSNVLSQTPAGGKDSSNNYYATTDANGNFSITGDYTCPSASAQVYLFSKGGNSGAGSNPSIGLLAGLGSCGSLNSSTFVTVNEVSTTVTAFALSGFATDATHISSSGTTLALQGMANAMAVIPNMETVSTGVALATTPAGNGVVWQKGINAIANILASCINTAQGAGYCTTVLANHTGVDSRLPGETATAALLIAQYPGTNVSTLLSLQSANPPFQPNTTSTGDFTMGISYTGNFAYPTAVAVDSANNVWVTAYISSSSSEVVGELNSASYTGAGGSSSWSANSPILGVGLSNVSGWGMAIDPSNNIWIGWSTGGGLVELSSTGAELSPPTGFNDGSFDPNSIAIDGAGNIWSESSNALYEYTPGVGWANANGFSGGGVSNPFGIAISGSGNIWLSNGGGTLSEFSSVGVANGSSPFSGSGGGFTGYGTNDYGQGLAIDAAGNIWVPGVGGIAEFNSSGAPISGSSGFTGGGLTGHIDGIAIDGAGHVWAPSVNYATISELSSNGTALSTSSGYVPVNGFSVPYHVAIDGSGNVWVTANGSAALVEMVGAGTPVVTPMAANLKAPYGSHAVNMP